MRDDIAGRVAAPPPPRNGVKIDRAAVDEKRGHQCTKSASPIAGRRKAHPRKPRGYSDRRVSLGSTRQHSPLSELLPRLRHSRFVAAIRAGGLPEEGQRHITCIPSATSETARARCRATPTARPIILHRFEHGRRLAAQGHQIFQSENGVWLDRSGPGRVLAHVPESRLGPGARRVHERGSRGRRSAICEAGEFTATDGMAQRRVRVGGAMSKRPSCAGHCSCISLEDLRRDHQSQERWER
jgi:hypothetical protein